MYYYNWGRAFVAATRQEERRKRDGDSELTFIFLNKGDSKRDIWPGICNSCDERWMNVQSCRGQLRERVSWGAIFSPSWPREPAILFLCAARVILKTRMMLKLKIEWGPRGTGTEVGLGSLLWNCRTRSTDWTKTVDSFHFHCNLKNIVWRTIMLNMC